jgi:uncharacterized protein YqgV (UPF0045/DUF77 family)
MPAENVKSERGHLEVFVEPFKENDPGPHVLAVIDAIESAGLTVDMGPFATTADGDLDRVIAVAADLIRAGFSAGAEAIQLRVERT